MANAMMSAEKIKQDAAERRTFYRVNDAVSLRITLLDDDAEAQFKLTLQSRRTSGGDMANEANAHLLWRDLEENYPEVALYLSKLERRLEALLEQIGSMAESAPEATPTHTVNISGSGLHFDSETAYFIGQSVRISLRLFPSGQTIDALARVVREHKRHPPAAQGKFGCALQCVEILSSEREALLQHIHTLQMDALRTRSLEAD